MTHDQDNNAPASKLKLAQVNFQFHAPSQAQAQKAALERAHAIADEVSGLIWKVWIFDRSRSEAGGIYLFQDEASAQAYVTGDIFTGLTNMPGVEDMKVKIFDVNEINSAITRAPLSVTDSH